MPRKGGVPENLKPFKKGDDPKRGRGAKKGYEQSRTRLLRLLELVQKKKNPVTGVDEEFSIAEQMDMAQVIKALKGDSKAYDIIIDRMDGKATQKVEAVIENTTPEIDYSNLSDEELRKLAELQSKVGISEKKP